MEEEEDPGWNRIAEPRINPSRIGLSRLLRASNRIREDKERCEIGRFPVETSNFPATDIQGGSDARYSRKFLSYRLSFSFLYRVKYGLSGQKNVRGKIVEFQRFIIYIITIIIILLYFW